MRYQLHNWNQFSYLFSTAVLYDLMLPDKNNKCSDLFSLPVVLSTTHFSGTLITVSPRRAGSLSRCLSCLLESLSTSTAGPTCVDQMKTVWRWTVVVFFRHSQTVEILPQAAVVEMTIETFSKLHFYLSQYFRWTDCRLLDIFYLVNVHRLNMHQSSVHILSGLRF